MAEDMTWLDDCEAMGIIAHPWHYRLIEGVEAGEEVHRALGDTWLDRASPELFDELLGMYCDARMADDPMFIDEYPEEDEIERYLSAGETWVLRLRSSGKIVGACVLTQEAVLPMDAEVIQRGKRYHGHTPGENWFYGGKKYFLMKNYFVCPPLHPYDDMATLVEYASRASAAMGCYELRVLANLRNRTMCMAIKHAGGVAALLARRENNEMFVGFDIYRLPDEDHSFEWQHRYISMPYEKLTDEEYRRLLDGMGIDEELDPDSWVYRHRYIEEDEFDDKER